MSQEKEKLIAMLKRKKISENEFHLLTAALSKKSICENVEETLWINPFKKIAGLKALLLGLLIMAGMSIFGTYANLYFDSPFSAMFALGIKTTVKPSFLLLMYQTIASCLVLGSLYYIAALIFGRKRLRLIDFFGTVALSRYPYLVLSAFAALIYFLYPAVFQIDVSKGYDLHPSIADTMLDLVWMACYVWQILTYMFAFKESSGLEGKKFWISFMVVTFVVGDLLAMLVARMPLYMALN